jgi:hypothetical protein
MKTKWRNKLAWLALSVCISAHAEDAVKNTGQDFKIVQFPSESWDGKWLQFLVRIESPKMDGKTLEQAEAIRKIYVTQGLKNGLQFLMNIATYDPGEFNVSYIGNCDHISEFPPKNWSMPELISTSAKQQCDEVRARVGDKANEVNISENGASWAPPQHDISAKSYDEVLKFGNVIAQNHFSFLEEGKKDYRYQPDNRFSNMNVGRTKDGVTGLLYSVKDDKGQEVRVLNISVAQGVSLHPDSSSTYFDVNTTGTYRNTVTMPKGYSIIYSIPNIGVGDVPAGNGVAEQGQIVVPNRKLISLFQGSGPSVSSKDMVGLQARIEGTLNPFDLHLSATYQQGGLAGLLGSSDDPKEKLNGKNVFPHCVKSVDLQACKRLWAYVLLGRAIIEPRRDKGIQIL